MMKRWKYTMANILNYYAIFFTKFEAVESKSRSPEIDLFESTKFEKGKGSKLSVYKRNILVI